MNNAMSLKAKIRNIAKDKNIPAQIVLQNYMFERLLIRLSRSEYKNKFILKGGMLVAAIVGLDNRATMDLDATLKNLPLTPEAIEEALRKIISVNGEDDVEFSYISIVPIREDDIYGGYRVMLNARYDTIVTPLSIDISTGDAVTPNPVKFTFSEIFDSKKLRRSVFNTRPRDFYDAYILVTTQKFDKKLFLEAIAATAKHRGTETQISSAICLCKGY